MNLGTGGKAVPRPQERSNPALQSESKKDNGVLFRLGRFFGRFPTLRRLRLRGKLILPYAVLTLLVAAGGTYIITHLVTASLRERLVNQLNEAGRVSADSVVRKERLHLEQLRLVAFSAGLAEAMLEQDAQKIEQIVLPLALNSHPDAVSIIDKDGHEILTLGRDPQSGSYGRNGGKDFSNLALVAQILKGVVDERGDKYVEMVDATLGPTLFTSAPVYTREGELAGVVMIGTHLSNLLDEIKKQSLADLIVIGPQKTILASTLAKNEADALELTKALGPVEAIAVPSLALIEFNQRKYEVAYTNLNIRNQPVARLGVVLSSDYVTSAEATSRNLFVIVFTLITAVVIIVGYYLAQDIAEPILNLRSLTQSVAAGDLDQSIGLERADEIGELAVAFDSMTLQLRERTAETVRLYAEAVQRNKELAEINARLQTAQQQLIQSEKLAAVGQLTAGIVHDVKNPLAVIKGLAELMQGEPEIGAREELSMIHDSAVKANQIVTDLLKFARQSTPQMKWQDFRETIEVSLRLMTFLIRKAQVEVIKDLPSQAVMVVYDASQIEQVFLNLFGNAIQAMPNGGTLRIHLAQEKDVIAVAVQDTGTGIAPENLNRIFDPFFTTKMPGEGTGLGLSVSYGIITCHQGEIKVESTLGQGTTFTILLPVDPPSLKLKDKDKEA